MIDYVRLHTSITIPQNVFNSMIWRKVEHDNGSFHYLYERNGVYLRYYPETENLTLSGKILMLLHDTQVLNFDDIYGADRNRFMDEINLALNRLFPSPILDIRQFEATRIDYCFNVKTPYVAEYIDFFNRAFEALDSNLRKNYTLENGLDGSIYVRVTSDYDNNTLKNYTLNFYNKADRLTYQWNNNERVSPDDFPRATDILRLEAQCGPDFLKPLAKKFNIGRSFDELFDFDVAYHAISTVYKRVLRGTETLDYYTYQGTKKLLPSNSAAAKTLYAAATNHSITGRKYDHGRRSSQKKGIYPYCFLPKKFPVPLLENPLKLILRKIASYDDV